ncbi:MAG: right-handed parallel beta-helix repeat-containing protein [Gaiellaceae bacterium]
MRKRKLWLALGVATGALAVGVNPALADSSTLVVDDDKVQCKNAAYTTIQAAVAAAKPGDKIKVCAGTYTATTVDKTVRLDGSTRGPSTKRCLDRSEGENPTRDAIVNGSAGAPAFRVGASNVVIRGFTVQNTTNDAGISIPSTVSGTQVVRNLIQENTLGVYLNSNGARTSKVSHNCFRDNNRPGSAAGNGVYSDQGVRKADVEHNTFTGHANAAIIFVGPLGSQSDLELDHNSLLDDAPIILAKVSDSQISHNLSTKSKGSGIFFGGNVTGVRVKSNTVRDCAFTGINLRTDPANYATTAPNTGNRIEGNRVVSCGDAGIRLREGAARNVVSSNRVSGNGTGTEGDGISLEDADDNQVRGNTSESNRRDGLRADAASAGNRIEQNRMRANAEHDCHDNSTGSATAGTANTWRQNRGATQNRPGLCTKGNDDENKKKQKADRDGDDDKKKGKKGKKRKSDRD